MQEIPAITVFFFVDDGGVLRVELNSGGVAEEIRIGGSDQGQLSVEIGKMWDRLKVLPLETCRQALPDGVALARRLYQHLIPSGGGSFFKYD